MEMACLLPVVMMVLVISVLGLFYFHDKNLLSACAYETAVVGSTRAREEGGVEEGILQQLFQERIRGKCILFGEITADIAVGKEEITVKAIASRKQMKVSVLQKARVTQPENWIRSRKSERWIWKKSDME